jgi:hypothetical protein
MIFLVLWMAAIVLGAIHVILKRSTFDRKQVIQTFLLYQLAFGIGLVGVLGFMGHVFDPDRTAAGIGWTPSPPFQFELGAFEIGFAIAAFLCLVIRNKYYWLGVVIAPCVFYVLAAGQHIWDAAAKGNLAPYNVVTAAPDILIPVTIMLLIYLYFHETRSPKA